MNPRDTDDVAGSPDESESGSQHAQSMRGPNTRTTRRRVCQALAVLGATSLAGCGDDQDVDSTDRSATDTRGTGTATESAADIGDLIDAHVATLEGKSYTIDIELQGSGTDPSIKKRIEYLRSASGEPLVSLTGVSTIDDGVESLTQYFTPDLHGVEIRFIDGTNNAAALDISSRVLTITGASVFERYLGGAAVAEPYERTATESGDSLKRYEIKAHDRYDLESGVVEVGPDRVIRRFRLEWTDKEGTERWVDVIVSDVGSTDVDRPEF